MNILIPNATGPKNIGDEAILYSLVAILQETYRNPRISIHTYDPAITHWEFADSVKRHIYSYAAYEYTGLLSRVLRTIQVGLVYWIIRSRLPLERWIMGRQLSNIVDDYREADLIVFTGGGIFRSKKGVFQFLNLAMQLYMLRLALVRDVPVVLMPMSFGPFGYKWQEKMAIQALRGARLVFAREKTSHALLEKYNIPNSYLATDLALFLSSPFREEKAKPSQVVPVIGFTVRSWFPSHKQEVFEKLLAEGIGQIARKNGSMVIPISQVHAGDYGEDDSIAAERVAHLLRKSGLHVEQVRKVKTLEDAHAAYGRLDFLIGMRMHSNILAALSRVPFIGLAYEHKMSSISAHLGLEKFTIDINDEGAWHRLISMIDESWKSRSVIKDELIRSFAGVVSQDYTNMRATLSQCT